jgi:hypothetical protein
MNLLTLTALLLAAIVWWLGKWRLEKRHATQI